ncbi:MAG TPA: hypothetical protein P5243_06430 [Bacteroidales bacterium]|nr:hypothetical protein [Bacteroidales bacterium]
MTQQTLSPQDFLLATLDTILHYSKQQKQHKVEQILPIVHDIVRNYPHILWHTPLIWKLAKVYMIMYHYDGGDDENFSMNLVKQAYIFSQRAVDLCEKQAEYTATDIHFDALHTQVMILNTCQDVLVGALAEVYMQLHSAESNIQSISNKLAQKIVPIIAYNIVVKIDDAFTNFNNNAVIERMCNDFELSNPDITTAQLEQADKVHAILIHSFLRDCFPNTK